MYGSFSGGVAALSFLFIFQFCGLSLSALIFSREAEGPKVLLGSVLGSVSMQWLPALTGFAFGFTTVGHGAAAALMLFTTSAAVHFAKRAGRSDSIYAGKALRAFLRHKFLFFVLALSVLYCILVPRSFYWEDNIIYSSQATYGDMSMHLSFITSLARQGTFPPCYSLLPGTRLSYPFLSDSISASLYLLGAPLRLAYCLPMLLAGFQVFFGCWLFLRTLLNSEKKAALAFTFFFLNGGLGLMYFLGGEKGNFSRIFTAYYETPTNYSTENIRWVNVIADMMLPQRATLFGWALLFPTLYVLTRAVFHHKRRYYLYAGLMAGALPMIHTHSFLALGLVCGAWLTARLFRDSGLSAPAARIGKLLIPLGLVAMTVMQAALSPIDRDNSDRLLGLFLSVFSLWAGTVVLLIVSSVRKRKIKPVIFTWGVLLLSALALALPQLFTWTFRQVSSGGMVRGHFGWVIGEDNYLWFYLKNIGLVWVFALLGLLTAKKKAFARYCPCMAIWFVSELVEFQPNDYDNNKLLYVGFLFLCCAAADWLWEVFGLIPKKVLQYVPAVCLAAVLAAPAALTLGREYVSRYELYGTGAMDLSLYMDDMLPAGAVILTDQRHNNEAAALAGRNVVCGSPIYLYYHGLNYYQQEQDLRPMYEAPGENLQLFERYNVGYVLISDFERSSYEVDTAWFEGNFPKLYDDGGRALYWAVKLS